MVWTYRVVDLLLWTYYVVDLLIFCWMLWTSDIYVGCCGPIALSTDVVDLLHYLRTDVVDLLHYYCVIETVVTAHMN